MRSFKFRAWDTYYEKMVATGFSVIGEVIMFGIIDQYITINPIDGKGSLERYNDIVLMQFTGLIDKNGVDIYDGDIVTHKFNRIWKTEMHTSQVIWDTKYSCYYLFYGVSNHRMRDDSTYEVIGNIYQSA